MALRDILAAEGLLTTSAADELALQQRLAAARTYVEALEAKIGKTAAGFNSASPFARKLGDLVGPLMGPGSRISVSMGRGEFSSKMGLQIRIINPKEEFFAEEEEVGTFWAIGGGQPEETSALKEAFQATLKSAEDELSRYFGLPVHTEGTEETAITFTVELRVQI